MSPTEIEALAHRTAWRYAHSKDPHHSSTYTFNQSCLLDFSQKLIAAMLKRIADEEPVSSNAIARAQVLMAADQARRSLDKGGDSPEAAPG